MAQTTAQKLGVKPGATVLVSGQPTDTVEALLGELPAGATLTTDAESADIVLLFADTVDHVTAAAPAAWNSTAPTGRFWVAYRKGAKPLHRDTLQAALGTVGLEGVTLISLDEVWSALRAKTLRDA